MSKKIITIGFELPGYSDNYYPYASDQSLLDADVIFFEPNFEDDYRIEENYQGKPCYYESDSFELREATSHWKRELSTALEEGKTVFIFFSKFREFFIHTGETTHSGTGRSARKTRHVEPYNNYKFSPVELPYLVSKGGSEVKFNNNPIFSTLWAEFKDYIKYESYIENKIDVVLFSTKTGEKPIGGLFKVGKGHLVLLPPIRYSEEEFTETNKEDNTIWTKKALQFGERFMKVFINIDKALKVSDETTPPPNWVSATEFKMPEENLLIKKITHGSKKIDKLVLEKNRLSELLRKEVELKNLLFEKGTPLEKSIIEVLHILGYSAERYDDGQLELDGVILSPEGDRFIGEVEGKDNTAVNIDKFRQLESNIQEDLERKEVESPAIGILFGNGFRLTPLKERKEQFTEKCIKNAKRLNVALIRTVDLFRVAKYIKINKNKKFAKDCRNRIKNNLGKIIEFPSLPKDKK